MLLLLRLCVVPLSFADDLTDKFISNLEGAVQRRDRAALSSLVYMSEVEDASRVRADLLIDHLLSMKECKV